MPTKIEWTANPDGTKGETWNPVTGCSPVSTGCSRCYARRMAKRLAGRYGYPKDDPFKVTLHPDVLDKPLHWKKPRRIFVCSMSDLFHEEVPCEFIDRVLEVVAACPQHTFLVLTKRAHLLQEKLYGVSMDYGCRELGGGDYMPNLWLGVSVENQQTADERIPFLLSIPAAVHFVSVEPLLGPIDLRKYIGGPDEDGHCLRCGCEWEKEVTHECPPGFGPRLDWVICGGESGPGARPMDPDWARSLRDQCQTAGVAYFMKQLGGVRDKRHLLSDLPEDLRIREYPETERDKP